MLMTQMVHKTDELEDKMNFARHNNCFDIVTREFPKILAQPVSACRLLELGIQQVLGCHENNK